MSAVPPIYDIRIPNPFFEGANSVYVIRAEPLTLIDTGVASHRACEALIAGLHEHKLELADIERVLLTHKHIDHIGNAWRVQQCSAAEVLIHETELEAVEHVDPRGERFADLVRERLQQWHVPSSELRENTSNKEFGWEIEPLQAAGLVDGQQLELGGGKLQVVHTPGHTMGSVCLKFHHYLFTGDHVLQELSPNVGGGDMRQRGLLQLYLRSLQRVAAMDRERPLHAMPGHGQPFGQLRQRCDELMAHHDQRIAKTLHIIREHGALTVYEVARQLFGQMQDFHIVLGCAEAAAHLEYLIEKDQLVCRHDKFELPDR